MLRKRAAGRPLISPLHKMAHNLSTTPEEIKHEYSQPVAGSHLETFPKEQSDILSIYLTISDDKIMHVLGSMHKFPWIHKST